MSRWIRVKWSIFLMTCALAGIKAFYQTEMTVTEVEHGVVTLQTGDGVEYTVEEAEAWRAGETAACLMYTNGTEEKEDDVLMGVRYVWEHERRKR